MTKQLATGGATDANTPKRHLEIFKIIIFVKLLAFAGKQGMDVAEDWAEMTIRSSEEIKARTTECLKEYNEQHCDSTSAPEKCR